jgi:hypothetical protein
VVGVKGADRQTERGGARSRHVWVSRLVKGWMLGEGRVWLTHSTLGPARILEVSKAPPEPLLALSTATHIPEGPPTLFHVVRFAVYGVPSSAGELYQHGQPGESESQRGCRTQRSTAQLSAEVNEVSIPSSSPVTQNVGLQYSFLALHPHPYPDVIYWAADSKQLVIARPDKVNTRVKITGRAL